MKSYFKPFDREGIALKMLRSGKTTFTTTKEITQSWDNAGKSGTALHQNIELFLLQKPYEEHEDFPRFMSFWSTFNFEAKGFKCYPEYKVFDELAGISGTIDCLLVHSDGRLIILDWKRTKKINKEGFNNEMGKYPFNLVADCNYNHYSLQLNFYRTIFSKNYLISGQVPRCVGMFLIVFTPESTLSYEVVTVPEISLDEHWLKLA